MITDVIVGHVMTLISNNCYTYNARRVLEWHPKTVHQYPFTNQHPSIPIITMSASLVDPEVSAHNTFTIQYVNIHGPRMAYIDTNETHELDATAIFLHGNPTSSYIWRNIIPHVMPKVRCVAPDLIGMGLSEKPDLSYRFEDHVRYLDAFIDTMIPKGRVILVLQDWGSALGFHWARRHEERVAGIAFMEFMRPFRSWEDLGSAQGQALFKAFRAAETGRKMLVEDNMFITTVLPGGVVRELSAEEMAHYASPYPTEKSREPVYRWPNEISIEGYPEDVHALVQRYHDWLLRSETPKLLFWADPGALVREKEVQWYSKNLQNLETIFLGKGLHYLQEDHPHQIGETIAAFVSARDFDRLG
jgi:haloalkane dehalogenase